ncbi:MAG: hypothetical protein V4850_21545 [Myxococcota bacterium]
MIAILLALIAPAYANGHVVSVKPVSGGAGATQAVVGRAGAEQAAMAKLAVATGDTVRTGAAWVTVELDGCGTLVIAPDSEVVVARCSVEQLTGNVFYRVQRFFRVRFGSVEAVVEGTTFSVWAHGASEQGTDSTGVHVTVRSGVVRVRELDTAAGGPVAVEKGQTVRIPDGGSAAHPNDLALVPSDTPGWLRPVLPPDAEPTPPAWSEALAEGWALLKAAPVVAIPPVVAAGMSVSARDLRGSAWAAPEAWVRVDIAKVWSVEGRFGVPTDFSHLHLGGTISGARWFGPIEFGPAVVLAAAPHQATACDDPSAIELIGGGGVRVGARARLGHLELRADVTAGLVTPGTTGRVEYLDAGVGVGLAF